jgi:phosphoglycerol transferase MdoB-like AlkP superfamily enzyme
MQFPAYATDLDTGSSPSWGFNSGLADLPPAQLADASPPSDGAADNSDLFSGEQAFQEVSQMYKTAKQGKQAQSQHQPYLAHSHTLSSHPPRTLPTPVPHSRPTTNNPAPTPSLAPVS